MKQENMRIKYRLMKKPARKCVRQIDLYVEIQSFEQSTLIKINLSIVRKEAYTRIFLRWNFSFHTLMMLV